MPGSAPKLSCDRALEGHSAWDVEEASDFLYSILGDSCSSTYRLLEAHLATYDTTLPPLLTAPASLLGRSPALLPSPSLNSILSSLVASLLRPHEASTSAALAALLADPLNSPWISRAAAIRRVAAAAEGLLELSSANDALARPRLSGQTLSSMIPEFPYISNYDILAEAEANILDRALGKTLAGPVAFLGSGPLPLSGIVLGIKRRIPVMLVDVDPKAVEISRSIVRMLEDASILKAGLIQVICADAKDVKYASSQHNGDGLCAAESPVSSSSDSVNSLEKDVLISCEAVIVASLVPVPTKEAVARAVAVAKDGPRVVLVRSAVGMVAQVAYEKVSWTSVISPGLEYVGEWVPYRGGRKAGNQVLSDAADLQKSKVLYPATDDKSNAKRPDVVLGFIDGRVLNSVEVFRTTP